MERKIKNYKAVLFPLFAVVVLIALGIGVANFLLGRINSTRSQITDLKQKNGVLANRLETLQSSEGQISQGVSVASLAVPPRNPSVLVTSILKKLASENEIGVSKLSVFAQSAPAGAEAQEDATQVYQVTFETASESYDTLANFIFALSKTRPILKLESVRMESSTSGIIEAQIALTAYSAPFPGTLPALDEPLSALSLEEQETISLLESFAAPDIVQIDGEPTPVAPRDNPFTLGL